ncbi:hypothetical protein E1162_11260 [Rhodobacteraceae bacterium RKSG542]|uniref:hypothetical protein n=1 Tax=Pseudovibrio flavus TaxID=2529854 RepID=UPI0012BCA12A|nr:hypothetical protein [Pseudovibrio flavus]MTI17816.1 hypothetical protein [Pseudovibrio flavus]
MSGINLPSTTQCKWAEGESGNYTFPCKNPRGDGSYCEYHAAIVYETPEQRKARAEQARAANNAAKRIAA